MSIFLGWLMFYNRLAILSSVITLISFFCFLIGVAIKKRNQISKGQLFVYSNFNTKNITYMAIMIACSVSVTVVISLTLPITVFPPIRVAFEGIMIKITGMIFGPIIGLLVGIITELLIMLFIPSFIHIAYFFVAFGFGFWAGIGSFAFKVKKNRQWIIVILISLFVIVATWMFNQTLNYIPEINGQVKIFGILISKKILPTIFTIYMMTVLVFLYLMIIVLITLKKFKFLQIFIPIFLICVINEVLITVIIVSWGDADLLTSKSKNGYISMVALRAIQLPLKIIFNTLLLSTVYSVLRPLIKNK